MQKILVGIPAYNEASVISRVISAVPRRVHGVQTEILVVNDGSYDKTGDIVHGKSVFLLDHLINRGLGGALKTIISFARIYGFDYLVTLDADGQHNPNDIGLLLNPIIKHKSDFVIGSRWKSFSKKYPLRYLVNTFANLVTFFLFGIYSSDSQSGFRALNRRAITTISLTSDGMEVSSEFFREVKINGLRYKEVSIKPVYSEYSRNKGQKLTDAPGVLFQLLLRLIR